MGLTGALSSARGCTSDVFEFDSFAAAQAGPRLLNPLEETRIVLDLVIEPIILRGEAHQHAGRPAVPRNDNFFLLRHPEVLRQIILYFRQRRFLQRFHRAFRAIASSSLLTRGNDRQRVALNSPE